MKSQWNDSAAREMVEAYAAKGVGQDIALRVYTTRLLGRDPLLVLHGGGNTSVKTRATDDLGQEHEVIAVKGSGADMADIEPWGLPAVKLDPLKKLRALDALSDEAMVNVQRLNLLELFRAQPVGRDACCTPSCRTNSSITPTPPPCCRWSTSLTARRWRARSMTGAWESFLTSRRASASPRKRRECSRRSPTSRV